MEAQPREVRNYRREDGKSPIEDWLNTLRDRDAKAKEYWADYEKREDANE
jgi:hypothetical protein